jgi:hypothetical protein
MLEWVEDIKKPQIKILIAHKIGQCASTGM